jgi:glycerol-3-phosphate dehydrogenase subunit C
MTAKYSPFEPGYFDEAGLRDEMLRVFDICHGCRLCFNLCPSFPTLFNYIDSYDGQVNKLTEEEQNRVVSECYQCKLCYNKCPYVPPHEWNLDFPRMMMRANAVIKETKNPLKSFNEKVMASTDLVGVVSTKFSGIVNKAVTRPGTFVRKAMEKTTGLSAKRMLPPYSKERFSSWWAKKGCQTNSGASRIALFPTCFVEYMAPKLGIDICYVLNKNSVEVTVPSGIKCCGAPLLHSGKVKEFQKKAAQNLERLLGEIGAGRKILVPQPTCGYVLKKDYPIYLQSKYASKLSESVMDVSEYLFTLVKNAQINEDYDKELLKNITYHAPCHLRAQNTGFKSRDVLKAYGAKVKIIDKCSGIDGTWGYYAENVDLSLKVAAPLKNAIESEDPETLIAGDCHLANTAIFELSKRVVHHPLQLIAEAYRAKENG